MIISSRVFIFPNWDIADAMIFNTITKKLSVEEKVRKGNKGAKFSEDHASLVIWSLKEDLELVFLNLMILDWL